MNRLLNGRHSFYWNCHNRRYFLLWLSIYVLAISILRNHNKNNNNNGDIIFVVSNVVGGVGFVTVVALTPITTTISVPTMTRYEFLVDAISHTVSAGGAAAVTTVSFTGEGSSKTAAAATTTTPSTMTVDENNNSMMIRCQNGELVSETPVPGAYNSICMSLNERTVPLIKLEERRRQQRRRMLNDENNKKKNAAVVDESVSSSVIVQQQPGGSGQTGMSVWNSGLLLTRLLDTLVDEMAKKWDCEPSSVSATISADGDDDTTTAVVATTVIPPSGCWWNQQDVIELGCGTGLVSIATYKLGAKSVLATDGNPLVVQLARRNIERNDNNDKSNYNIGYDGIDNDNQAKVNGMVRPPSIQAVPLQWGLLNAMDYADCASLVLGADLTYNAGSWRVLAETMVTILQPNGYVIYMSLGHDGFNVNAEIDGFVSVAKSVGLIPVPDLEGYNLSTMLRTLLSDTEQKIVASSGGAIVLVLQKKQPNRKSPSSLSRG